jgi:hypothetical protein
MNLKIHIDLKIKNMRVQQFLYIILFQMIKVSSLNNFTDIFENNFIENIFYDTLPDTFYIKYNRLIEYIYINLLHFIYKILFPEFIELFFHKIENILVDIYNFISNYLLCNLYILIFINICYVIFYNNTISKYKSLLAKKDTELYMYKNKISKIQHITRNLKYNNMTLDELYKEINLAYFKQCNKYVMSDILRLNYKLNKIEQELV